MEKYQNQINEIEALEAFRYLPTEYLKGSAVAFHKALQKFGFKVIENDELEYSEVGQK
ncbi:Hypothetical protein Tpal_1091 [Trichococcus palustris]|uniref:Uncharacterized protein n=1 Tax=Trichococcus palustris TaxID=140314 RepID=A0A143YI32_9LACT|nr:hypothetical protein [Trichococcus palustris]CZQ89091.1 Hypothetical protein Tpal_1091 [Trichococcus palustris]SFL00129.1 hypothetical protein SAMN04488076_1134 [Trichococcus palustris]